MQKKAIESADYYPDSRKRRHNSGEAMEKGLTLLQAGSGASTMAVFHHAGFYFGRISWGCKRYVSIR
jgi:hypothetical protein